MDQAMGMLIILQHVMPNKLHLLHLFVHPYLHLIYTDYREHLDINLDPQLQMLNKLHLHLLLDFHLY
tara:strand:+ start:393 stop:593 length:201 start_codon:yes stop_codon:yes gene_type:complete